MRPVAKTDPIAVRLVHPLIADPFSLDKEASLASPAESGMNRAGNLSEMNCGITSYPAPMAPMSS
jgi:hypothetical protein